MKRSLAPDDVARMLEVIDGAVSESLFAAPEASLARELGLSFERRDGVSYLAARAIDAMMFNRAFGLGDAAPATPGDVDLVLERLRASGAQRFFVSVSPLARPAELPRWLEERGLTPYNRWARLWREAVDPPEVRTTLRVEQVGPERRDAFAALVTAAFHMPEPAGRWFASTVGRSAWRHYLAFDGDVPVAGATLFVHGEVGYLGMAATAEAHRGRGAQHALIARRMADARAAGCRWLTVETAEDKPDKPAPSFRNLRGMGFELAYLRPNWLGAQDPKAP